ncbi:MAG TPA: endonuclease/exonuclease/phosphatase family protein [Acidimicrobiales bacterium]
MWGSWWGRRLAVGLAVVVTLGATACSHHGPPSGDFVVLSYNVAGLPQEISQENPEEHMPLISPLLADYDVVLTQEDFDWWRPLLDSLDFIHYHERLRAQADHEFATAQYPGPEATGVDLGARPALQVGDGLGVLSRFPLSDELRVPWSGCFGGFDTSDGGAGDCLAAKGFARVTVLLSDDPEDSKAQQFPVDVYTLHGEAGATEQDQLLQQADFVELADYITQHSVGRAVIVGGDTNLHTHSDHPDGHGGADTTIWDTFLATTGLTDSCAALHCRQTDAIDKIAFRSGGELALEPAVIAFPTETFVDPEGQPLSDHPPLAVAFRWQGPGD